MKVLTQNYTLESFFTSLSKARQKVLMLDYDGTIAPFQVNRMEAVVYPEVYVVLEKLINQHKTKVVIITGRQISDLVQIFNLAKLLELWGCHGLERLTTDNHYEIAKLEKTQLEGLEKANKLFENLGLIQYCETKLGSIALHWRGLDFQTEASIYSSTFKPLRAIANTHKLKILDFAAGVELCVPNRNKAFAVKRILSEMEEEAVSAYLGDDLTDEYAFSAIKNKGLSILVNQQLRFTYADICLETTNELVEFFQQWIEVESL